MQKGNSLDLGLHSPAPGGATRALGKSQRAPCCAYEHSLQLSNVCKQFLSSQNVEHILSIFKSRAVRAIGPE